MATSALSMQNYFSTTLSAPLNATTDTVVYLNALPNASEGYLEIDEGTAQKEIIYYTSKGGSFVTCPSFALGRGIGGTSASAHASGAVVKQKVNAEYWQNIQDGSALNTNAIAADKLATSAITLGYAQTTSPFSTASSSAVQVTGLSASVTIPAGGRRVKITAHAYNVNNSGASRSTFMDIWDGTVGSGTLLGVATFGNNPSAQGSSMTCIAVVSPSAGAKTYNVGLRTDGAGTVTFYTAGAPAIAFILVEAI
jgi:hypothetical protein